MKSITKRLSQAHTILGAIFFIPLAFTCLTGIILGWYDELRYAREPYGLSVPSEAQLPPTELVKVINQRYSAYRVEILFMSLDPSRAVRAKLGGPSAVTVFLHPGTGLPLDARILEQRDWLDILYDLHPGKPFGLAGQVVTAVAALALLILWGLGITLWFVRRPSAVRTLPAPAWRAAPFHRWAGFWLGAPFIVLTGLGAALNFAGSLIATFDPPPKVVPAGVRPTALSVATIVEQQGAQYRWAPLERIVFPKKDVDAVQLRYADGGWAFLDGYREIIIEIKGPLSHWTRLLYPLHSGRLLGVVGPWLVSLLGVLFFVAMLTGIRFFQRLRI